jgi:hypothetical protein
MMKVAKIILGVTGVILGTILFLGGINYFTLEYTPAEFVKGWALGKGLVLLVGGLTIIILTRR